MRGLNVLVVAVLVFVMVAPVIAPDRATRVVVVAFAIAALGMLFILVNKRTAPAADPEKGKSR